MIKLTKLLKEAQLQRIEASKIQKTLERVLGTKVNYDINSNDNYEFYINSAKFMIGIGDGSPKSEYAFSIYNDGATKILAKGNADSVNDLMKQILSVAKKHKNSLLQTESVNEESFTAINKDTGKVSVFKSKDSRDAAVKAGTHDKKEDDGEKEPKGGKPNMFSKDAGYDAPDSEKKSSTPKLDKDGDGGMSSDTSRSVEDYLNKELGLDGSADLNSGGAIEYNIPDSTDTLLIGDDEKDGKPFSVGLANEDGFDPGDTYKSFDNQKDAMAYAKELAQKLKGEPKSKPTQSKIKSDPKADKVAEKISKKYKITPQQMGEDDYKVAMGRAVYSALTNSNFHSEARELIAKLEGKPELAEKPNYPSLSDDDFDKKMDAIRKKYASTYSERDDYSSALGRETSDAAQWDGVKSVGTLTKQLRNNGMSEFADKIESIFDGKEYMKNEGTIKLTNLLKGVKFKKEENSVNEMKVVNKETGKDITRHVLDLLKGKIDKKKFEKLTGLKKESSNEDTIKLTNLLRK